MSERTKGQPPEPAGGMSSAQRQERLAGLSPREELAALDAQAELGGGGVPQPSAILGPCAGGAVYSPAIPDFIVMAKGSSSMFIPGPDVIKTVTHEEVTKDDLGGAQAHNARSGVAHFAAEDEPAAIR